MRTDSWRRDSREKLAEEIAVDADTLDDILQAANPAPVNPAPVRQGPMSNLAIDDHVPRRLHDARQAYCEATRVWLLLDRWGNVTASSVDQFPGLRVIDMPRARRYAD